LLVNLVDWLAYLGCILAAVFIAGRLGAGKRGQLIAAAFNASLPMAIAQASSSMTDIVVAFWVMCAIAEIVSALASRNATWRTWLYLAAATGLAVLTKTTAFAFVLPFLLWFGIKVLFSRGMRWTVLRMLPFLALVVVINLPFWLRNTLTYGTPLGSPALIQEHANQVLTLGVLLSNVVRNLSLNFGTPSASINHFTSAVISKLHRLVGMNLEDPRTTFNHNFSITDQVMMEDRTGNPVHLFFILIAAGTALLNKKYRGLVCTYSLVAISTFLLFSIGNTYQVFGNRLLVPFFLLSAPLVGLVVARFRPWLGLASGFLLVLAGLPWLLSLQSRPILPIPGQTISTSILDTPRLELYFANVGSLGSDQKTVIKRIRANACTQVGLMLKGDDPEYLWWVLLGAPKANLRIEWIVSGTPSDRFTDPAFKPCAVICTSCPTEWKAFRDLPLQYQSGDLRLFLKSKP
jgi:4-amino-4-deoxy-L-arabinose transferase-like glycosyltransferase